MMQQPRKMGAATKEDDYHMTLQQIADAEGVSKQYVAQVLESAQDKIRKRAPWLEILLEEEHD